VATRERAFRLMRFKLNRSETQLLRHAMEDLNGAERLLAEPEAAEKPHILRAADAFLDVAQWRLRGVEQSLEDSTIR
jgi:hypothetical protein